MVKVRRGEIWWVRLDGTEGSEQSKTRPCVIIQNNTGNNHSPTTIIAVCSSVEKKKFLPTHYPIECLSLKTKTFVQTEQIRTISTSRLQEFIGKCENMEDVDRCLKVSLGLD